MPPKASKRLLLAGVLFVAAIVVPAAYGGSGGFAPVTPQSPNADDIRTSYLFISVFVGAIFVAVEAILIVFIFRFRRRNRPRFEDGPPIHGATRLELIWTVFPVVVLFAIAAFVLIELPGISHVPSAGASGQVLEIRVTGRQFYWQYEYPNGAIAIDTMRAPAGVPVRLEVVGRDEDVIHSWWIPALGGKIDAIPGIVNTTWFRAKNPGIYTGQCAELCGLEHARMLATVEVLPEEDFDTWLAQRRSEQSAGTSELGDEEWGGVCAKCHGLAGEGGIGPKLAGSAALADQQGLVKLIRTGRGNMPPVGAGWTAAQVKALTSYLKEHPPGGS